MPALFKMSERSLRLSLLGSTPKDRENNFVARSMLNGLWDVIGVMKLLCGRESWRVCWRHGGTWNQVLAMMLHDQRFDWQFGDVIYISTVVLYHTN